MSAPRECRVADIARVDALVSAAARILRLVETALAEVPEAEREAVAVVLAGGFAAEVVMGAEHKDRAMQNILASLMRAGMAEGLVQVQGAGDGGGCGDPDCPTCSNKGAGERRPMH